MTPTEAAALLTICAAYDNRKPDPDAAKAWSMALDGYRFEDCRTAIVDHYRTSREWIMPSDVITAVKRVRRGRLEGVAPTPPAGMDPDDTAAYAHWLRGVRWAIADGREVPAEEYGPTRQIGELRGVLRTVPAIEAKPRARTVEHGAALAKARAELPDPAPTWEGGPDESEACSQHRGPEGPNEDVGQCHRCGRPIGVMRPDNEQIGLHADDCSLPLRHRGHCQGGGQGHAPVEVVRGFWPGMDADIAAARAKHAADESEAGE